MVALTFPDGARREYPKGSTGLDIAKKISPSLAKRTVAMALDGVLADLKDPIERDAKIEFLTREDPRALVSTLALRPLARHQRRGRACAAARLRPGVLLPCQAAHCVARFMRIV